MQARKAPIGNAYGSRSGATIGLPGMLVAGLLVAALTVPVHATTLTVHVRDGQSELPLVHAFVMVGLFEGDGFDGNLGFTDGSGTIVFDDPTLASEQTVTAGAPGFGYTTLSDAAIGELTLPLFPALLDSLMGGTSTNISGTVSSMEFTNNDGKIDVALVAPAVSVSAYVFQDMYPYYAPFEPVEFPIIGTLPLPGNIYMPDQIELLFFHFSRTPWHMAIPGNRDVTFFSVSARVAISDLVGGTAFQNLEVREIGVERDVHVTGPMENFQVVSDLGVTRSLTTQFHGVPNGNELLAVSGALIHSGGRELALGFDTRGGLVDTVTTFQLASRAPGGDLSDAVNVALGAYTDSSAAIRYSTGIVDRDGFVPPHTTVFDSWMRLPVLTQHGHFFGWGDPTNPGVSPSPTWTRSNLGLRAIDPADSTIPISTYWRVYAPAAPRRFVLPELPAWAPGPPGGLPDPDGTPEADQLYWTFVATNSTGTGGQIIGDFIHEATHWTQRWDPIQETVTGVDDPPLAASSVRLRAEPNPALTEIRLSWRAALPGSGQLVLRAPDGRRVREFAVPLSGAEVRWDGRDGLGHRVPAGVYWATLHGGGARLAERRLIWIRATP